MDAKLAVSDIIYLVSDIATDAKRSIRPNILVFPYLFLSLSCTHFLYLIPEMRRSAYYGLMWEGCEVTPFSSSLGETNIYAYRLTSVGSCTILKCLAW